MQGARVAQQIIMDFWVLDDAKLLNILLDGMGLGEHEHIDKFGCANGYTHAFQACYMISSSGFARSCS